MIEAVVTSTGLIIHNAEFALLRPCSSTAQVSVQTGIENCASSVLVSSQCQSWITADDHCAQSVIEVTLSPGGCYDLIAWSEADDRSAPTRDIQTLFIGWTFEPNASLPNPNTGVDTVGPYELVEVIGGWGDCPESEDCEGDMSGDGTVDAADLAEVLGEWGQPTYPGADLNGDGIVGPSDLAIVLGSWGPIRPAGFGADLDGDGTVGPEDIAIVLFEWDHVSTLR